VKNSFFFILVLLSFSLLQSCGLMRSTALGVTSPLFFEAGAGFERERNWDFFKTSVPGNLKLLDGLLAVKPNDTYLLSAVIKGYAGYAFTVNETLYLSDKFAERRKSFHKDQALFHYTKALDYGRRYLKNHDVTFDKVIKEQKNPKGAITFLRSELPTSKASVEAVVYTAQALASLINLQKNDMFLVSYLPVAKSLFDWACEIDPRVGHGVCQLFKASYEASRPRMLGGNPEKGKEIFKKAIANNPHQWLIRVAFLEHYVIPMSDENEYRLQKKTLQKMRALFKRKQKDGLGQIKSAAFENPDYSLYQATAIKRFEQIKKYENDLF